MDHRFPTSHPLTVDLQVPAGTVAVRVHDAPVTTVHVEGARADGVEVTFDERPSGDRLSVVYRGKKWFTLFSSGRDLEVTVVVPVGTTLDVSTGAADLEVSGTVAALSYRSGSGDLRFDDVTRKYGVVGASTRPGTPPGLSVVDLVPAGTSQGAQATAVVEQLRAQPPSFDTEVGGPAAELIVALTDTAKRLSWEMGARRGRAGTIGHSIPRAGVGG